jgi:DnaJ-class molecular chaperone
VPVTYKDYYQILGVPKTADAKAIKSAYRKLARKHHPDQNPGNKAAADRFKEINEANEVLSDPEKRQRYDTLGPDWERYAAAGAGGFGGQPGPGPGGYRVHVDQSGDLGDFSEFFRTIFGDLGARGHRGAPFEGVEFEDHGRFRTSSRGRRGGDLETEVEISLDEAYAGTRRAVEFEEFEVCGTCGGTGRQGKAACPTCGGSGRLPHTNRVEVKIPAGVRDGSRVRAAGEGGAGSGGTRGDLYLRIHVTPHPLFERREDDLHVDVPVAMWEAALGAEVEVPTLRGKVSMKIPPETSSGRTFRLPGYGMPHLKGGKGDQYVRVRIVAPTGLSARERALFEELRSLRPPPPRDAA